MSPPVSSAVSKESNLTGWNARPKSNRPLPIVSARSEKIGPNVAALRRTSPVDGSVVNANPPDEDGNGKVVSCDAIALFNSRGASSSASPGMKCI